MVVASHIEPGPVRRAGPALGRHGLSTIALCAFLLVVAGVIGMQSALAIGLGAANVSSALGEPLRLSVPVTLQPDEEVGCIQVRPGSGDLPAIFDARAQVVRSAGVARIEIRSSQPVNEPAVGLVLSVGCASPIARDYVLFLDPPAFAPTVEGSPVTPSRRVNPMPTPVRRATGSVAGSGVAGDGTTQSAPAPRPARPKVRAPAKAPTVVPEVAATPRAAPAPSPVAPAAAPSGTDRLSVLPTEPPRPGATPAIAGSLATPVSPASADGVPAIATIDAASAEAAAREDALKRQQSNLQAQLQSLSDQIAALRVQATTLAERNRVLEQSPSSPWWLIGLAVLAILLAAWMAWRYFQLRRSVEGSAWWTSNTVQHAAMGSGNAAVDDGDDEPDAPTRAGSRSAAAAGMRSPPATVMSNVGAERPKPVVRPTVYAAAMDTDFTVSDIEAAMATVRTVSPPRPAGASKSALEDSDFAPLGGPTLPSPFSDPPPGAAAPAPLKAGAPAVDPHVAAAQFVDFDIAAIQPLSGAVPVLPVRAFDSARDKEEFDPLATNSLKTTIFEPSRHGAAEDPRADAPTSLDFELPTATQIMALTDADHTAPDDHGRHAGTLLDDLFQPSSTGLGVDTILDLDERHGQPLSMTEVDRLITTDADLDGSADRVPRTRMAKFADLMNRVDEVAATEPLKAIAQLRQFVLRDEDIPTLLWLRLFELYRQVDKKPVYNALAEHFARRYHRPMIAWGQSLGDHVPQTPLSAHVDIDREIEAAWGTDAGRARLETLLCGHDQDDTIVFNAVLQHDLLDAAKVFPAVPPPATPPA